MYKKQLAVPKNCEYVKVLPLKNNILKNKKHTLPLQKKLRTMQIYADRQQLLTQVCTAATDIANNCHEAYKFNKIVSQEHWSRRLLM